MTDGPCSACGTYRNPALTVDAVVVRGEGNEREVLLIRRGQEPWKGCWAFPGYMKYIKVRAVKLAVRPTAMCTNSVVS